MGENKSECNYMLCRGLYNCFAHSEVTDTDTMKQILEDANLQIEGDTIPFQPLYVTIITMWCTMLFSHSKRIALHVGFP